MAAIRHNTNYSIVKINLTEFLQEQNYIQKERNEPYFKVLAIQAPSVTLTWSDNEKQRKTYYNFLILIRQSIQILTSMTIGPKD